MMDTSVMQERIGQLCGQFKLPTVAAETVARFTAAGHGDALATFLEVLEQEAEDRRHRRINRLRRESRLPSGKTWETFDHDRVPLALRQQLDHLARGSFVERGVNVLAFGLPGTGKTHALCALGHRLVEAGHSVLFAPAYRLVQELLAAKRDLDLPRRLRKLDNFDFLLLDDLGYLPQGAEESEVLFTLIAERYERRSLGITSNLVFSEWERIFANPMATAAAIDRVIHHSVILEFDVPSYRTNAAQQRAQAEEVNRQECLTRDSGYTDILAEVAGGGKVVIENQLELSDNDHFVRLVGYAADHDAKILIWAAPQFDEYHQRLLGWLDQALGDDRSIHAVQVKLVPSGDLRSADADPEAPGFRAEFSRLPPRNNWPQWSTLTPFEPSELNQRYRDFFQTMIGDLRPEGFTDRSSASAGNDQSFPTDFAGISYNVGFWSGGGEPSLDVYLWIATDETARNKQMFDGLSGYQDEIEGKLAGVAWDRKNHMRMCSIYFSRGGTIASPEEDLVELREWAVDQLVSLRTAFAPRLEKVMCDLQSNEPEGARR